MCMAVPVQIVAIDIHVRMLFTLKIQGHSYVLYVDVRNAISVYCRAVLYARIYSHTPCINMYTRTRTHTHTYTHTVTSTGPTLVRRLRES